MIGKAGSKWIWGRGRIADFSSGNLAVSGSLHVTGNPGCIGTGDLADGKQNLYRRNALHGADRKKGAASWTGRPGKQSLR